MDDDDEERSRSIPSRTKLGKRATAINKFPALGEPLVRLFGLINIPYWGYRTTSIAMLDVMLSDMPRVEYGATHITQRDVEEAKKHDEELQKRIQAHGLGINLDKKVNTDDYMKSRMKEN